MNRRGFVAASARLAMAAPLLALPAAAIALGSPTAGFDAALSAFLARHLRWNARGTASAVDYATLRRERAALQRLQDDTSRVAMASFQAWPLAARQAFLVNAYNIWTLALIADAPADTGSIRELGNLLRSPWKRTFVPLLGDIRSLDDIEHGLLRGAPDFDEPRIHFAVNCASIGCPALRPEAYTAERWAAQLDDQTRRFLRDTTRNRVIGRDPLRLGVSAIFDWYGDDFESAGGVQGFLARYPDALGLTPADAATLRRGEARIAFLDYDWSLNDRTDD
jgi:hypothetical protein